VQVQRRTGFCAFLFSTAAAGNAPLDADTLAALNKLPLLHAVPRKSLRVRARPCKTRGASLSASLLKTQCSRSHGCSSTCTARCSTKLACKGDLVTLPIAAVHRDEGMWALDARE
jgi:hypothetical protein